ncbi:MAG TPA: Asp-tRNA(Asn)/Glu-tRNA(Gln) amidotransferase subunit GatA [Kofleriaceae bacterium]|nr:Asp-tRNA(Asn)/Glu-tRNA(Gln) amidotransferase subunit GatA [Kofleriaceae bacterium]
MSEPLHYVPAGELARRVRAREVSAREVLRATLDRIAAVDPRLGAFLHVDAGGAAAQAAAVDDAIARRSDPGPLAGVPIALKDVLVTGGVPTTAGSRILEGWVPPASYSATVVERLRAAGAVLVGKLNLDEFAMGSSNENSAFRPVRNPWDLERVPGGSSGGAAAAVAAGLCAAALGTDTGGSIRQPASLCGVVGLKPTYGRVSRHGVIAFASSLDQVGPLARSVADAALVLEVIAGFDPLDSTSVAQPPPSLAGELEHGARGLTIGRPRELELPGVDPEVTAAVDAALDVLVHLGATVTDVSLPHATYALPTYYLIAPAEASSNLARYDGVRYGLRAGPPGQGLHDMYSRTRGSGFGAEVKRRIMLGTFALRSGYYDAYYKKAQQVRALIAADYERAFAEVDLIATPTSPTAAFRLGEKTQDPVTMYLADVFTLGAPLAGLPGISVPCGFTPEGLPVGLQLLARALDEATLVRAAAAFERATPHGGRRPPEANLTGGAP